MGSKVPILVVDDNAANLKLARVTLEAEGFEVGTATNAREARAAVAARRPALVLMDLQLPGVDGLALTRELKADPATRGIVVVALTAYAMKGDEERARAAGCEGYLPKPSDTRTFARTVAGFLEPASAGRRVLIVEDNPSFGKLLRLGLETAGFAAELVDDPDKAAAAVREKRPDLVVLDGRLRVPGDGLGFCNRLKGDPATRSIPVIMLSGTDAEGGDPSAPDGPDMALTKTPESLGLLASYVRGLLERRGS